MKRTAMFATHALLLATLLFTAAADAATPQSTAFTYQGNLNASGHPASGDFDLQFKLFDAETSGTQVGATITLTQYPVVNGIFTADLDFPGVFAGNQLWLEVSVGTQTLSPRQPVNSVPVAEFALSGNAGPPGARGYTSLIGLTPELPGNNCVGGGTKIATGADLNANGVLDAGEVTATSYLCNIVAPVLPAQCNANPLSWSNPAIDYNFSDLQPGAWTAPNTGSFVTLAAHPVDANTCGTLPVTPYAYSWSLFSTPAGSKAELSSSTGANPVLIPDVAGAYVIQASVKDALGNATPPAYLTVMTSSCGANPITVSAIAVGSQQNLSAATISDDADSSKCPARFAPFLAYSWSVLSAPVQSVWQFTSPTLAGTSFVPSLPGTYMIGLKVTGSGGQAGSGSIFLNLAQAPDAEVLQSDADPTVVGQSVTFTSTLQWNLLPPYFFGPPTGTVTFLDGATKIAGCIAMPLSLTSPYNVCTTSSLTSGSHSITSSYSGDVSFQISTSAPLSHTVN